MTDKSVEKGLLPLSQLRRMEIIDIHEGKRLGAATNKDLLALVEEGRFRADLYYRLNVVQIWIPALRERPEDISLLFNHFIRTMSPKFDRNIFEVEPAVINCLKNYNWPGNIRELQNVAERILLVAEHDRITIDHLPPEIVNMAIGHSPERWEWEPNAGVKTFGTISNRNVRKLSVLEQEQQRIAKALDKNGGNISKAAVELGISRSTLYRKMKHYHIEN
jgi:transcriptional regulator with PAS, ATPase and Fis domain